MGYKHGIYVDEEPTKLVAPVLCEFPQLVFGVAPINLVDDPYSVTNTPIVVYSMDDAKKKLGYSENIKDYTLCQSMDASFKYFAVAPVIMVNVLNPSKHKAEVEAADYLVVNKQAKIEIQGLLLDTLVVKDNSSGESGMQLNVDEDYIASFDENGNAIITVLSTGTAASATKLNIAGTKIDPSKVTSVDIIGGHDAETGDDTGIELIRRIFPTTGYVPGIVLAPKYSKDPIVSATIAAKLEKVNECFTLEAVVDLDSGETGAKTYDDVKEKKEEAGLVSAHIEPVWPMVKINGKAYYYSAIFGAMIAMNDYNNSNIPNLSGSNKPLPIDAICLDDDENTEIFLDQEYANIVNAAGVVTAINMKGFRSWGNNTAYYSEEINTSELIAQGKGADPKDRWFNVRRFFSWWGNSFILNFIHKVDNLANVRLIESLVDEENIRGNSLVAQGYCAGAVISYNEEDNPTENIVQGQIVFKQKLAAYTPAEYISNTLEFSPDMLQDALTGGEE